MTDSLIVARRYRHVVALLVVGGLSVVSGSTPAAAQEIDSHEPPNSVSQTAQDRRSETNVSDQNQPPKDNSEHGGAFIVAPLPISSPAIGSGIVPVVAYIFSLGGKDQISAPSVVGAAGLATNNGSRALVLAGQFYFKADRYRATGAYGRGNLNYDLYGLGSGASESKVPLKQEGQFVFTEFLRQVRWQLFVGPRFFWGSSLITVRQADVGAVPLPPDLGLHTNLTAVGLRLNRDTRSNRFYPSSGTVLDFTSDFFSKGLGSKYSFQSYKFTFSKYGGVGENQVLAYNLFACATGGQPPFYGNCVYGTNNQLRGYTAGRYLDRYMLTTQLEYRVSLPWRFGLVAFGGLGEVVPGGNQTFTDARFLPSGGGGLRFLLSKKYHVNLRVDLAQGVDGHTWAMSVGEAF